MLNQEIHNMLCLAAVLIEQGQIELAQSVVDIIFDLSRMEALADSLRALNGEDDDLER